MLVNDGHPGPVKVGHDVLQGEVEERLWWVKVDGELAVFGVQVDPRLQVRNVQGVTYGVDVGSEYGVAGTKYCVYSKLYLLTSWIQKRNIKVFLLGFVPVKHF